MAIGSVSCFFWLVLRGVGAVSTAAHGGNAGLFFVGGVALLGAIWALASAFASLGIQGPGRPFRHFLTLVVFLFGLLPSLVASAWMFRVTAG